MSAKEPTPPPEGVVRPDPPPAPPKPTQRDWDELTRAHVALIAREEGNLLERIGILSPQKGDIVVLETEYVLSLDAMENIRESMKRVLPDGVECIVLESGLRLTRAEAKTLHDDVQAKTADRIATALERLVELAEQGEPEMDVDIEIDADGKLMHVTAECYSSTPNVPTASGAYVLAHDPDAAARAAKTWWGENGHVGITGVKVNYDE